ncbi:MAG: sulfurtransferase, partial [Gammaproteobacteria bacterium]|nr:sulfurtransferase [Gammaproteobacteria bacterium]
LNSLQDNRIQIWDARSAEEYAGTKVVADRGGHIPGAINLDWLDLMDRDRALRLREDLSAVIHDKGLDTAETVITHCQTHHRSGLCYFVGRLLGLNIKAYHGSWSEWGNDPDTPIDNPAAD